ncbi:Brp/Blh family beta-carotene 15,15'-dioxygenase [Endozoicomonas lisbonensis]|uniref:Brp/Blh family beta-carotene 15,15'-monooxygenase n=1 Tax=Endozoicomonas lisbonensis TaxID=3120522 RepID=A0ABV2SBW2_9GAMM
MPRLKNVPVYLFGFTAGLMLLLDSLGQSHSTTLIVLLWIYLFGVPHGGLDLLYIRRCFHKEAGKQLVIIASYTGLVVLSFMVWLKLPVISMVIFLVASAWHFSGDWQPESSRCQRLMLGLLAVVVPAITHREETGQIFAWLLLPCEAAGIIALGMQYLALIMLCILLIQVVMGKLRKEVACPASMMVVGGLLLSPILYFASYFCGLHAIVNMIRTFQQFQGQSKSLIFYLALSMFFTTLLFLVAYIYLAKLQTLQVELSSLFIGLFSLTMPHIILHFVLTRLSSFYLVE